MTNRSNPVTSANVPGGFALRQGALYVLGLAGGEGSGLLTKIRLVLNIMLPSCLCGLSLWLRSILVWSKRAADMTEHVCGSLGEYLKMGLHIRKQEIELAALMMMGDHPSRDAPEPRECGWHQDHRQAYRQCANKSVATAPIQQRHDIIEWLREQMPALSVRKLYRFYLSRHNFPAGSFIHPQVAVC